MKRFIKSKKGIALLATLVVVAAAAIGAYAFVTASGSGTGSAASSSPTATWTIPDFAAGTVYVGGSAAITGSVTNSGQAPQGLNQIVVNVTGGNGGCATDFTNGDFTLSGTGWVASNGGETATYTESSPINVAPGASTPLPALTLSYANEPTRNQDSCETGSVALSWSAS